MHAESPSLLGEGATVKDKRKWLIQLQRLMQSMMEIGTEKLEVTSQMLDTVSIHDIAWFSITADLPTQSYYHVLYNIIC